MTKDPVCGMQVDEQKAPASSYQGKKFWFCGQECKDKFDRQPQRYTEATPQRSSQQGSHQQEKQQSQHEHSNR